MGDHGRAQPPRDDRGADLASSGSQLRPASDLTASPRQRSSSLAPPRRGSGPVPLGRTELLPDQVVERGAVELG